MTRYEYLLSCLVLRLSEMNGVSVRIISKDMYLCRALSFSYTKIGENAELLNHFAKIAKENELTIKTCFVGKSQRLANSDKEWYKKNEQENEDFFPDMTIDIDKIKMPKEICEKH